MKRKDGHPLYIVFFFAIAICIKFAPQAPGGTSPTFEIIYKDEKVTVEEIYLPSGICFFVSFKKELPLFLTKNGKSKSWASTPPGYQEVAEEVGILIEEYMSNNQQNE